MRDVQVYASGVIAGSAGGGSGSVDSSTVVRWAVSADGPAAHVDPANWWVDELGVAQLVGATRSAVTGSVHGASVAFAERPGIAAGCDAIVTDHPNLALVTLAADCVPVVLADPDCGLVAAVHCGWQGLTVGVVSEAVRVMVQRGARAITAVVGPSICATCYPVDDDRLERVRNSVAPSVAAEACLDDPARIAVAAGVVAELHSLREIGVQRIDQVPGCTAQDPRLFSFRGSGTMNRHAMVVAAFHDGDIPEST